MPSFLQHSVCLKQKNEDVITNGERRSCHFRVLSHQPIKVTVTGAGI